MSLVDYSNQFAVFCSNSCTKLMAGKRVSQIKRGRINENSLYYVTCITTAVLLEVSKTDYQVELGGSVAVNCSQTGYLRTPWKWNDTQGNDISPIGQDNRMRTDVSAPTKLGNTEVDNHQMLFLYIDDVRMMDAGEYYCSLENKDVKVRLDVREPGDKWVYRHHWHHIV